MAKRAVRPAAKTSSHPVKKATAAGARITKRLRAVCEKLPGTVEVLAWGEPTWRVKKRIYAQFDNRHHGSPHIAVWIPAPPGAQEALVESDPDRFFRPPYVGHRGWVAVILDGAPDWEMVGALVAQAHAMIAAPKRPVP